jgi:hypothetical protein
MPQRQRAVLFDRASNSIGGDEPGAVKLGPRHGGGGPKECAYLQYVDTFMRRLIDVGGGREMALLCSLQTIPCYS